MRMMQHRRVRYISLDVHRATMAVAIAEEEGTPSSYGTIANDPAAVRKLMRQLGGKGVELQVASEAEFGWRGAGRRRGTPCIGN